MISSSMVSEDEFTISSSNDFEASSSGYETTQQKPSEIHRIQFSDAKKDAVYYHVDLSKIKLYVYSYTKRILIEQTNQIFKSQVDEKMKENNNEIRTENLSNEEIPTLTTPNGTITKKKHPQNTSQKKNSFYQDEVLKKEIDKALRKNESSNSILILHLFSFFALLIIIMKGLLYLFFVIKGITKIDSMISYLEYTNNQFENLLLGDQLWEK